MHCSECTFDSDQDRKMGRIILSSATTSFINYYKFMELDECKAAPESFGSLTPNVPLPVKTPDKTPLNSPIATTCIDQWVKESNQRKSRYRKKVGHWNERVRLINEKGPIEEPMILTPKEGIINQGAAIKLMSSLLAIVKK